MNVEMNILKALAIIAVVIGHSRGAIVGNVYLYHMALFVFISGYFYKDNYSTDIKKFVMRRFKSLYIPFLKFNLIFLLFRGVLYNEIIKNDGQDICKVIITGIKDLLMFNYTDSLISSFWFVKNLFYINIIFCVISYIATKISSKNKEFIRGMIVVLLFVVFFNIAMNGRIINGEKSFFTRAFILNIFFYMGFLYNKYEDKFVKLFKPIFLIISFIYIATASKGHYIDTFYFKFINMPFFIVSAMIGIFLNIYVSKILNSKLKTTRLLEYIGENSLWVLCFHMISFKVAILIKIKYYNLNMSLIHTFPTYVYGKYDWILDVICGIFIPTLLCYIFKSTSYKIKKLYKRSKL